MKGSFNTSFYKFKNGPENVAHRQAKVRIYDIAPQLGWKAGGTPENEIHFPEFNRDSLSIFTWPMDVCLTRGFAWDKEILDVEIDGKDHERDTRQKRDKHRDEVANSIGIRVVRFDKDDIIGKNSQSDEWILERLA